MKNIKICIFLLLIFSLIFGFTIRSFADDSLYIWSDDSIETSAKEEDTKTDESSDSNSLKLESPSAILIEQTTGQVLYAHNVHEKLRPASVTKVMSILLIMEALDDGRISLTI